MIYVVHLWCQGHLATHEEGDLLGSLQCFFYWRRRLARFFTVISTDGFGGTHSVSFIELNMSTPQKLVSCGSSSVVILSQYFWYWVPMLIQMSNFEIGVTPNFSFGLLFALNFPNLFPLVWNLRSCSGWVCYFECPLLWCDIYNVQIILGVVFYLLKIMRCDI